MLRWLVAGIEAWRATKMHSDYAVPLDRNREMLAWYRRRLEAEFPGRYIIFDHIGDAHVHVIIFPDPEKPALASDLLLEFARHAVELGGAVSAEHGGASVRRTAEAAILSGASGSHARR
jgi:FAD/FMN-containing dehydrogenase